MPSAFSPCDVDISLKSRNPLLKGWPVVYHTVSVFGRRMVLSLHHSFVAKLSINTPCLFAAVLKQIHVTSECSRINSVSSASDITIGKNGHDISDFVNRQGVSVAHSSVGVESIQI